MSGAIISVENLGKKYRISHQGEKQRYTALRDVIAQKLKVPFQFLRRSKMADGSSGLTPNSQLPTSRSLSEDFWALKDVSFEVKRGEVVGIIGRNGAGKSTLLKILSRITEPTTGRVTLRGRVASLLEVGTGFHPELTGRENVFLNGAILGMSRAEIRKKFDEIVAFAEVEKFLDTPVKRYSSGMYVRLAFAVAAHLEPEILIVDEVLAVGDAQFQIKCLEKMRAISETGRTVIFVSHNLSTIRNLCKTAVLLEKGKLILKGEPVAVIGTYLNVQTVHSGVWRRTLPLPVTDGVFFQEITLSTPGGTPVSDFDTNQIISINIRTICTRHFENIQIGVRISNQEGIHVFTTCNTDESKKYIPIPMGRLMFSLEIPAVFLPQGRYTMEIISHMPQDRAIEYIDGELSFFVHDVGSHATALKDGRTGTVNPLFNWRMKTLMEAT